MKQGIRFSGGAQYPGFLTQEWYPRANAVNIKAHVLRVVCETAQQRADCPDKELIKRILSRIQDT